MPAPKWEGPLIVYRLSIDRHFQEVRPLDQRAFSAAFPFEGYPIEEPAGPISCTVDDISKPVADFSYLQPGTIVFSKGGDAASFVDLYGGQLIPLDVHGELRYALNVTQVTNALDVGRSAVSARDDGAWQIERYSFFPNRLGRLSVFKIMQTRRVEILSFSGFNNSAEDEFPHFYRERQLTGLRLQPLWSLQA